MFLFKKRSLREQRELLRGRGCGEVENGDGPLKTNRLEQTILSNSEAHCMHDSSTH